MLHAVQGTALTGRTMHCRPAVARQQLDKRP